MPILLTAIAKNAEKNKQMRIRKYTAMAKNKKLMTKAKADEASDKELENVLGGTEIVDNKSIKINNNFDTGIKLNNFNFDTNINFNNVDTSIKYSNDFNKNILLNNNSDIKILKNN